MIPPYNILPSNVKMTVKDWQGEMFEVESSSSPEPQMVNHFLEDGNIPETWSCTCQDFYYRKRECKHIRMAKEYLDMWYEMREELAQETALNYDELIEGGSYDG